MVFDPRLPGMEIAPNEGGVVPSDAPIPTLPDNDGDIAYAPLTHLAGWGAKFPEKRVANISRLIVARLSTISTETAKNGQNAR